VQNPSSGVVGQRERNKRDKLLRIKNAARELFISKGDLLFLIANEDLAAAMQAARADIAQDVPLLNNLLTIFRDHYEYFSRQPELSRLMLREMLFYDSGEQANRFRATREHFMALINECVSLAQDRKEIVPTEDAAQIGWVIFCLYQVEIRRWLTERKLNLQVGMARLEKAISIVLKGVAADARARQPVRAKPAPAKARPRQACHASGKVRRRSQLT
jgi:AcrR family transcriptional regulator